MKNFDNKLEALLKLMPDNGDLIRELVEQEIAKAVGGAISRFDNFKVVEYPKPEELVNTEFAWKAGQMYVMVQIKGLINELKATQEQKQEEEKECYCHCHRDLAAGCQCNLCDNRLMKCRHCRDEQ